eukprot:3022051-Prymnesium_polylepis.1
MWRKSALASLSAAECGPSAAVSGGGGATMSKCEGKLEVWSRGTRKAPVLMLWPMADVVAKG